MQRHCKRYKKALIALATAVLTIALAVVPSLAIQPPIAEGTTSLYAGSSNLTATDAQAVIDYVNMLDNLNYFQFGEFVIVGRAGSTTRLYMATGTASVSISDGDVVITPGSSNNPMVNYNFVDGGIRAYAYNYGNQWSVTIPETQVLLYMTDGEIIVNDSYIYGTSTSAVFQATVAEWRTYYDKVYNYDDNIADAYDQGDTNGYERGEQAGYDRGYSVGYDIGEEAGYNQGLEEGEEIGYSEGYQEGYEGGVYAGYADGYETGLAEGNANAEQRYQQGVIAGQQVGYSQGYTEGQAYGYETGYREGQEYTYPIAYQEGYDDGYEEGVASGEGGDTIITEKLDIGSIISAIPQGAKNIINGALGFEIFGINVAGTLTAILVVAIIAFVIKWLMTR